MKTDNDPSGVQLSQTGQVELIAGPLCGLRTKWPHPEPEAEIHYHCGYARYRMEPQGTSIRGQSNPTARHVCG